MYASPDSLAQSRIVALTEMPDFHENALRGVIDHISEQSGELLEIVNFNLEDEQYVCAGHVSILQITSSYL